MRELLYLILLIWLASLFGSFVDGMRGDKDKHPKSTSGYQREF